MRTRFNETGGRVSPDGRWLTYQSDEPGKVESHVQSFPVPGRKFQVTNEGSWFSNWSADGKALRYILSSAPNSVFQADILPGPEFRLGPRRLSAVLKENAAAALAHDGWRVLSLLPTGAPVAPTITVVLDGLPGR